MCPFPFQVLSQGACTRVQVLTALVTTTDSGTGVTQQHLAFVGQTVSSDGLIHFTNATQVSPTNITFLAADPSTGNLYGLNSDGLLFEYIPSCDELYFYTLYPPFPTLTITALTYAGTGIIVAAPATDGSGDYTIYAFNTNVPSFLTSPQLLWEGSTGGPITGLNVACNFAGCTAYATVGTAILTIPLSGVPGKLATHSFVTVGQNATVTTPSGQTYIATISATVSDTLSNVYFTAAGLTQGSYSVQKILSNQVGNTPATSNTLSANNAGSVTAPVIDSRNNLYWATGNSDQSLSGVYACATVTGSAPKCSASSLSKWPYASQVSGGVVTVTVQQIVYG